MSLLIWAAVAASGVYWGLRLFTRPTPVPSGATVAAAPAPAAGALTRLLGEPPAALVQGDGPPPVADGRFRLIGVVAFRASDNGFAVRAVRLKSVVFVIERRFAVFGKAVLAKRKLFRDRLVARGRLRCGCRVSWWRRWGCIGSRNCGRSNSRNADIANEHYARCQGDDTYHKDFQ